MRSVAHRSVSASLRGAVLGGLGGGRRGRRREEEGEEGEEGDWPILACTADGTVRLSLNNACQRGTTYRERDYLNLPTRPRIHVPMYPHIHVPSIAIAG